MTHCDTVDGINPKKQVALGSEYSHVFTTMFVDQFISWHF